MEFDGSRYQISADDFGLSPGVNDGIIELAERGIVRRVSVLATGSFVGHGLARLKTSGAQIGFHFDLTFASLYRSPLEGLVACLLAAGGKSQTFRKSIELEFLRQWDILEKWSIPIKHFDGHQHVHCLPGVMEVVAPFLSERGIKEVRTPYDPELSRSLKAPLNWFAKRTGDFLHRTGFSSLPFAYPSRSAFESVGSLVAYLEGREGYEVLCHPAGYLDFKEKGVDDPLTYSRLREYQSLKALRPEARAKAAQGS